MPVVDPFLTGYWPAEARPPRPPKAKPWYKDWLLAPFVLGVFAVDQVTKVIVRANLDLYERVPTGGNFHFTNIMNTGSAFGFFPNQTFLLIIGSLIGVVVLLALYQHHPFPGLLLRASLGLQLGGALGNLVDRVRLGGVTDFIELAWWPVWNMADASILVGIGILMALLIFPRSAKSVTAWRWPSISQPATARPSLQGRPPAAPTSPPATPADGVGVQASEALAIAPKEPTAGPIVLFAPLEGRSIMLPSDGGGNPGAPAEPVKVDRDQPPRLDG
ncbi:MAG: signal peptidase II [Chloroflexota bacterium]|nr:signal peptidase II [Chloroflexota bacterium]